MLPQLLDPGFRDEDFKRLKDAQLNALVQDLRSNNEEELGKERLQTNIFRGTPYGHVALGTVAGINAITLDDVKAVRRRRCTPAANLTIGISGDVPDEMLQALRSALGDAPGRRPAAARAAVQRHAAVRASRWRSSRRTRAPRRSRSGLRSRSRARTRTSPRCRWRAPGSASTGIASGQLYQRIREVRGMNYGDYAYIEAFPRGMFQFFPDPNIARQRADLRDLDPPGRAGQRAHGAAHRDRTSSTA